jgi:hypothetical protein
MVADKNVDVQSYLAVDLPVHLPSMDDLVYP